MAQLLPSTAGFVPLHLYEDTELLRAQKIVAAINSFAMAPMGLGEAKPKDLNGISLREMLAAVDVVERYNDRPRMSGVGTTICMVPDDRLTAAVYTLLHYAGHDRDYVIGTFKSWHGVHFVAVGVRDVSEIEVGEDLDEEAAL